MVKIASSIDPITQRIRQLRNDAAYSAAMGNYKEYKTAIKEHARLAINNYELAKQAGAPKIQAPFFSKVGLNILKVLFLNFFRIKTPEEKELQRLAKENKLKNEVDKYIKRG